MTTLKDRIREVRAGHETADNRLRRKMPEDYYLSIPHTRQEAEENTQSEVVHYTNENTKTQVKNKTPEEIETLRTRWNYYRFLGSVARTAITWTSWFFLVACADVAIIALTVRFLVFILG